MLKWSHSDDINILAYWMEPLSWKEGLQWYHCDRKKFSDHKVMSSWHTELSQNLSLRKEATRISSKGQKWCGTMVCSLKQQWWCRNQHWKRRGLVYVSWISSIGQGWWYWYFSIRISIRRIICGFSSPTRSGFGPGRKPNCVLFSIFLIAIWWINENTL